MPDYDSYDLVETVETTDSVLMFRPGTGLVRIEQGDLITGLLALAGLAGLHVKTVTLTHAQIGALPTTPYAVVSAPGANKIIVPHFAIYRHKWAANYTNVNASARLRLGLNGLDFCLPVRNDDTNSSLTGLLAGDLTYSAIAPANFGVVEVDNAVPIPFATSWIDDATLVNAALELSVDNGGAGNFTGGHADAALTATVLYSVVDVP